MFETKDRWILKLLTKLMNVYILSVLPARCFHTLGGAKMMLQELHSWMQPGDFVYKTDVYSYYASLDHVMERWIKRGDCFYARFQDDIILVSRKRHVLRKMKKEMYRILDELRLTLRSEKLVPAKAGNVVGRSHKGFDLLRYFINPNGFWPNQKTQKKAFETAKRRYAQGGHKSLPYLKRWSKWVHAGLPFKIQNVEEIIGRFHSSVVSLNRSPHQSRVGTFRGELMPPSQKLLTRVMTRLLISDPEKAHSITTKGNLPCIKNYSGHLYC